MRDHVQSHSFSPSDLIFFNPNLKGQKTFYWKGQSLILTFIPAYGIYPGIPQATNVDRNEGRNSNHCFCVYQWISVRLNPIPPAYTLQINSKRAGGKKGVLIQCYSTVSDPKSPKDSRYPPDLSIFKPQGVLIPSHPEPQCLPPWPFQKEAQKNRIRTKMQSVVEGPFFYDNAFLPTSLLTRTY